MTASPHCDLHPGPPPACCRQRTGSRCLGSTDRPCEPSFPHDGCHFATVLCVLRSIAVEITRTFEAAGEVYATETPGGEAAVAVHRGPYKRINEAQDAIRDRITG